MNDVSYNFTGRVAFVTGAAGGIGRASAEAFGAAHAHVVVADINDAGGEETVANIVAAGGSAEYVRLDVSDAGAVQAVVGGIVERHGRLDFAHNNAGIEGHHVPLAEIPLDNWKRVLDVDLSSVFYCLRAEIPVMERQGHGAIVNTSSASGLIGGFGLGAYTAAKHGVVGLTRAAALDHGASGIRINAICPGPINTELVRVAPQSVQDQLARDTALRRLGEPDEVAQAVLWLCSDAASYVTGQPFAVDAGVTVGGYSTRFDDAPAVA